MGPKKDSNASKKRKVGESSSRQEPYENEPLVMLRPMALDVGNFGSSENLEEFLKCNLKRKVMGERVFPEDVLNKLHFPYTERLKEWGWYDMMTDTTTTIYSNVVKSFYYNAKKCNTYIESTFHGITYRVNREDIKKALGGRVTTRNGVYSAPDNFQYVQACRQLYRDPLISEVKKIAKGFPLGNRILHLIIAQVIHPRQGTFTRVDPIDIFLMSKIVNNDPFDLVDVMLENILSAMRLCHNDTNAVGLPYGKILTKVIMDKVTVNPRDVSEPWKMAPLALTTIGSMGWKLDSRTNTWRRKEELEAEQRMEAQDEDYEPQPDEVEQEEEEQVQGEEAHGEQDQGEDYDSDYPGEPVEDFMEPRVNFFMQRFTRLEDTMNAKFDRLCLENEYIMETQRRTFEQLTTLSQLLGAPNPPPLPPRPAFGSPSSSYHNSPAPNPQSPPPNPDP